MSLQKSVLVAVTCLLLAGCFGGSSGGGGSAGGDAVSEEPLGERERAPSFSELAPVTLEDTASPLERQLPSELVDQASRVVTDNGGLLSAALSDAAVILTPTLVDRPRTVTVALLNDAGDRLLEFRVNLINVAGEPVRQRAEAWLESRRAVSTLAEDCAIAEVVVGAAYVRQDLAYPDYEALRQPWSLPYTGEAPALADAYRNLASAFDTYRQGGSSADALAAAVDRVRDAAHRHQAEHGTGPVRDAYQALAGRQPPPERRLRYDPPSGRISSIVGNTSLGSRSGGSWSLDSRWAHLAALPRVEELPECEGGF